MGLRNRYVGVELVLTCPILEASFLRDSLKTLIYRASVGIRLMRSGVCDITLRQSCIYVY